MNPCLPCFPGTFVSIGDMSATFCSRCPLGMDSGINATSCSPITRTFAAEFSGKDQFYTVPSTVGVLFVRIWGAGGSGGTLASKSNNINGYGGGSGGYTEAYLRVVPGEQLKIIVGGGGACQELNSNTFGSYGGGGGGVIVDIQSQLGRKSYNDNKNGPGAAAGAGGGRSAIARSASSGVYHDVITAGGGGGGGGLLGDSTYDCAEAMQVQTNVEQVEITPCGGAAGGINGLPFNTLSQAPGGGQNPNFHGCSKNESDVSVNCVFDDWNDNCLNSIFGTQYYGGTGLSKDCQTPFPLGCGGGGGGWTGGSSGGTSKKGKVYIIGGGAGGSGYLDSSTIVSTSDRLLLDGTSSSNDAPAKPPQSCDEKSIIPQYQFYREPYRMVTYNRIGYGGVPKTSNETGCSDLGSGGHGLILILPLAAENVPTPSPTGQPTGQPLSHPSGAPSVSPSSRPSAVPSRHPTARPSRRPTPLPSPLPTHVPSPAPSSQPTFRPTGQPSGQPLASPTSAPSRHPTPAPSSIPTLRPTFK